MSPHVTRILVVEDNAALRLVVTSILRRYSSIEVVGEAPNGEKAVILAGQLVPHVIVMDLNMPVMNGIDATARIKNRYPETIVVGLTLNEDEDALAAMEEAGAVAIVKKEKVLDELYEAIQTAITSSERTVNRQSPPPIVDCPADMMTLDQGVEGNPPPHMPPSSDASTSLDPL